MTFFTLILRYASMSKPFSLYLRDRSFLVFFILVGFIYLLFSMHLPVTIRTDLPHDDAMYWGRAEHILQGEWMGPFSQMTLPKGAGYSIFLALNSIIGSPITLLISLFYLVAVLLVVRCLSNLGINKTLLFVLYVFLLFHPANFPVIIIRDNIYPALVLIMIAGFLNIIFSDDRKIRLLECCLYGLAFGFFWITREEGYWVIPAFLLILMVRVYQLKNRKTQQLHILKKLSVLLIFAISVGASVSAMNYYFYGKFESIDFNGEFAKATSYLGNVDIGYEPDFVPVSIKKREYIYKVSPSFLELKDYFEIHGKWWSSFGCSFYPKSCGELHAGWFMWAFRDAVAWKGYYNSPVEAENFYKKISNEINNACNSKTIKCRASVIPFMPKISESQVRLIPIKAMSAFELVTLQTGQETTQGPSHEPIYRLNQIRHLLGQPLTTPAVSEAKIDIDGSYKGIKIKKNLFKVYSVLLPIIILLGFFTYFYRFCLIFLKKENINKLFIVASLLWLLLFSRLILLILISISSFEAMIPTYISACYPISCLAALVSLVMYRCNDHLSV